LIDERPQSLQSTISYSNPPSGPAVAPGPAHPQGEEKLMHAETLGKTVYSYLRLIAGSIGIFLGIRMTLRYDDWVWGVLIAGLGLALALHESAYICACYTGNFVKSPAPPEEAPPAG
jgi:hypothetical protein